MSSFLKVVIPRLVTARQMSAYPKHYVDPVFSKEAQNVCKEQDEYNKLLHVPTKATKNDESASVFYNPFVQKMINYMTYGGNKKLARELFDQGMECIKRTQIERIHLGKVEGSTADPYELLLQAIENSRPLLQLTAIKRGGVTYQVPVPVTEKRSYFLAMKWLLEAAREKERKVHFPEKFAWEILDAAHGQGRVIKRKNDLHRQAESNRAYAHYRWS
ncbi:small ribosomal subunit protein uS7m [Stomoxys calcitrans]|uniref:Small ribosomal subunit protein uS7 domain-containing protein n=1 Tax=Stomoxys calcitrans TaxID=35570 RepID=A0A1I8PHX7_STOCA|nr:small ribosomal subunit protein uS7m [Stomoxys calcitrans]